MEDRSLLALGPHWQWEVTMGLGRTPKCLHKAINDEVVVWIYGPGYSHYRRFQAIEGDAVQFHIKSFRPISPIVGNERGSDAMSIQENHCDMPVLTRRDVESFRMGGDGTGSTTEEKDRSCDPVSPACREFFGESYGTEWLDSLCEDF